MSDTFAEEFEKWLENNPDARNADETDEEEVNFIDNDSEYTRNSANNDEFESDSEKWERHDSERHSELVSRSLNDQAPILVDDDDDELFHSKKQHYEEEPPILEPVPRLLNNYNISSRIPHQNHITCIRSYSKNQQKHVKYGNKKKMNHRSSHTDDESNHRNELTSVDNRNDNIFDKFISQVQSSEVLQTCSESSSVMATHPSHSPDFCAMEADSTSEINGDNVGSVIQYRRLSKSTVHGDISVECDSTCMLAASPIIVSPASVSNGEMEEARDSSRDENNGGELEGTDIKSKKCDSVVEGETKYKGKFTVMQNAAQKNNYETIKCTSKANSSDKDVELAAAEELTSHQDSHIYAASTCSQGSPKSSVTIKIDASCCVTDGAGEPPVLHVVSPSTRPRYSLREKRHTIDSPENLSASRKRSQLSVTQTNSENSSFETLAPPILTHASEAVIANHSGEKRLKVVSQHSNHGCVSCHQHKTHHQRRQKRRNTVPSTHDAESYAHLSEDVRSFVVYASQLSRVQAHMHRLLSHLFPQLKMELGAMSPECFNFMTLLSDLVKVLEQPDDQDNSTPPCLTFYRDDKPTLVHQHPKLESCTPQLSSSSCGISDESSSSVLSSHYFQASGDTAELKLDATFSECSSPPVLSSIDTYDCQQKQHRTTHQLTSEGCDRDLLSPLSLLTVRDMEEVLTPSRVLLCKEPEVLLEKFVRLSCRALQLLLPDLTVSLYNELAMSPNDLVAFINNVIYTNSRRRSKH